MKKFVPNLRSFLALTHDAGALILSWLLAFSLRFNFDIPDDYLDLISDAQWIVIVVQLPIFIFSGNIVDCAPVTIVSPFLTDASLGTSTN